MSDCRLERPAAIRGRGRLAKPVSGQVHPSAKAGGVRGLQELQAPHAALLPRAPGAGHGRMRQCRTGSRAQ
jgi:hypothetical protein